MVGSERGTQGAACIPRGGLNPHVVENSLAQNRTVADAIQCNPARHGEIPCTGQLMRVARHLYHHLLAHFLYGECKITVVR